MKERHDPGDKNLSRQGQRKIHGLRLLGDPSTGAGPVERVTLICGSCLYADVFCNSTV
jgi:hypothetical protein